MDRTIRGGAALLLALVLALVMVPRASVATPRGPATGESALAAREVATTMLARGWVTVRSDRPRTSSWREARPLRVGAAGRPLRVHRSYLSFSTQDLVGRRVLGAELNVRQVGADSCRPHDTRVHRTAPITRRTTWDRQPRRLGLQDTNDATAGCRSDPAYVGWDVRSAVAAAARAGEASVSFSLSARQESARRAHKQFDPAGAQLYVTSVSRPDAPTDLRVLTGSAAAPCDGTAQDPQPVPADVRAVVRLTSPDGSQADLRSIVTLTDLDDGTASTQLSSVVTSEQDASVSLSLAEGGLYRLVVGARTEWDGGARSWAAEGTVACVVRVTDQG